MHPLNANIIFSLLDGVSPQQMPTSGTDDSAQGAKGHRVLEALTSQSNSLIGVQLFCRRSFFPEVKGKENRTACIFRMTIA